MQKIYMKINGYEEASFSLLISFASDTTKYQDPDKYPSYAYQPMNMWPDVTNPTELLRRLAVSGIYQTELQAREESFVENTEAVESYKALVGQTTEYDVSDLVVETHNSVIPAESNVVVV